jgi:hypothetical protein
MERVEIAYARQTFDLDDVAPGQAIRWYLALLGSF